MPTTKIEIQEMEPKFVDSADRYNNWYNTADFEYKDKEYCLKLSVTEGSLLGQHNYFS
jgi:hypothetical protein